MSGRVLGVDPGTVRIGLALSDPLRTIASPLSILKITSLKDGARKIVAHAKEHEVQLIVIGMPLLLSGAEGASAEMAKELAELVRRRTNIPIETFDERLTSKSAENSMHAAGLDSRAQRGRLDSVAAALMLQAYLDFNRS